MTPTSIQEGKAALRYVATDALKNTALMLVLFGITLLGANFARWVGLLLAAITCIVAVLSTAQTILTTMVGVVVLPIALVTGKLARDELYFALINVIRLAEVCVDALLLFFLWRRLFS